jgi:hypothetical protein
MAKLRGPRAKTSEVLHFDALFQPWGHTDNGGPGPHQDLHDDIPYIDFSNGEHWDEAHVDAHADNGHDDTHWDSFADVHGDAPDPNHNDYHYDLHYDHQDGPPFDDTGHNDAVHDDTGPHDDAPHDDAPHDDAPHDDAGGGGFGGGYGESPLTADQQAQQLRQVWGRLEQYLEQLQLIADVRERHLFEAIDQRLRNVSSEAERLFGQLHRRIDELEERQGPNQPKKPRRP